jgi:hypothetical protein
MNRTRYSSPRRGRRSAQLEHVEAALARIVGFQGAQALLARSRKLCGGGQPSCALLLRQLLRLVRKFLGNPLAQWLLQSASSALRGPPARPG